MAGAPYRIVYLRGDGQRFYYAREIENTVNGISGTKPFFSADVREARKFYTPGEAVARRDAIKPMWTGNRFFIESCSGGDPLFEDRGEVTPTSSEDHRRPLFVSPDGYEESGLGFLVVPAFTQALGRCWACRSCDVPSLNVEASSTLETVYDRDPVAAVERARAMWGPMAQLYSHPGIEARAEAQFKQLQNEIQNPRRLGLRPGDRPR